MSVSNAMQVIKAAAVGSETERLLASQLFDDAVHLITTLEMNRIASLTYGEDVCGEIFDMIESVLTDPLDYSVLTVTKALVLVKHVLQYGSEKSVHSCLQIKRFVEPLQQFNTVLWALERAKQTNKRQQQQRSTIHAATAVSNLTQKTQHNWMKWQQKIVGGSVDRGEPVREAATALAILLNKSELEISHMRHQLADPHSLVPVGSNNKAGFMSEELRLHILKKRIEKETAVKSNLAAAKGGFGGGFTASDGKSQVVGASHGLDEMLARAAKEKHKYTDDARVAAYRQQVHDEDMERLGILSSTTSASSSAKSRNKQTNRNQQQKQQHQESVSDQPVVDLLDFGGDSHTAPVTTDAILVGDLLGGGGEGEGIKCGEPPAEMDLLGLPVQTTPGTTSSNTTFDLLDMAATATATTTTTATTSIDSNTTVTDIFSSVTIATTSSTATAAAVAASSSASSSITKTNDWMMDMPTAAAAVQQTTKEKESESSNDNGTAAVAAEVPKRRPVMNVSSATPALDDLVIIDGGETPEKPVVLPEHGGDASQKALDRILMGGLGSSSSNNGGSIPPLATAAPPAVATDPSAVAAATAKASSSSSLMGGAINNLDAQPSLSLSALNGTALSPPPLPDVPPPSVPPPDVPPPDVPPPLPDVPPPPPPMDNESGTMGGLTPVMGGTAPVAPVATPGVGGMGFAAPMGGAAPAGATGFQPIPPSMPPPPPPPDPASSSLPPDMQSMMMNMTPEQKQAAMQMMMAMMGGGGGGVGNK